jgi:hypothetical protein
MQKANKLRLVATLLLGCTSTAALAAGTPSDVQATFTIGTGMFNYDSTDGANDASDIMLSGSGSVAVHLAPEWSLQFDVAGEQVSAGDDTDQYAGMQAVGAHATWRASGQALVGVFAGYGSGTPTDKEVWSGGWVGVEGQYYFDNITLYGQASVLNIADHGGEGEGFDNNAHMLRGVARYFINDDMKVEGTFALTKGDDVIDDSDNAKATEWGISLQGRLTNGPLYGSVAYRHGHYDATTEDDKADANVFSVGLSYMFGTSSLKDNDRNGVSLDTPTEVVRASGVFSELD